MWSWSVSDRLYTGILQETFAEYTARTAFERPLLSGVAYAQRVVHFDREVFEGQHGWTIKTMEEREPSPVREEYAPVIFSQETVSYLQSIDMMSGEVNCSVDFPNRNFDLLLLFCSVCDLISYLHTCRRIGKTSWGPELQAKLFWQVLSGCWVLIILGLCWLSLFTNSSFLKTHQLRNALKLLLGESTLFTSLLQELTSDRNLPVLSMINVIPHVFNCQERNFFSNDLLITQFDMQIVI